MTPCQSCGSPTGGDGRKRFCDPCVFDRRAVVKARYIDTTDPLPEAQNRPVPRAWRTRHAPLTRIDEVLRDTVGGSECYVCKYLRLCRSNVTDPGFRLPCFLER